MADAKITLTTEAKNDGLEKLNKALAEGQQSVAEMTRELNNMRKATKEGTEATKEQKDAMVALRQSINEQKAANKSYAKEIGSTTAEIKKSVKAMSDGDKGARALAGAFKSTEGFTTAFSVALGGLAATITTGVVTALGTMASQVVTLGAQMQQSIAQLAAMTNGVAVATEAYRALNDVYRNTNFDQQAVFNMGEQLMRLGYSAESAAGMIQLCADASAGLGTGQAGAQQLVDALSRMQAVGELTSRQMQQLAMAGVNMDAAFASLGMTGKQAMQAVEDGTLDSQKAIGALTQYLHQYDGKMAEVKNNTIDAWGDVTGNLSTMCAEIGNSIFDAFNQSGIIQTLIDFTQSLIDIIRGDGCGAFADLRAIADEVLNFIAGLLQFVFDTIKLVIVIINDAYIAFKNFGAQVVDAIRPAVDAVMALYNAVKAVMSSVGAAFHSEVARSVGATFGRDIDPEERVKNATAYITPAAVWSGGGGGGGRSGGGGGGGSAKAQLTEEEKAVDALTKKYADAEKQKWALAKSTVDLAKATAGMMVGEAKAVQDKQNKIDELKLAHDQLMDGYNKELMLAGQIKDADKREKTIDSIMAQIRAEKALYDAKVTAAEWEKNYADLQKENKGIIEKFFGDPEDVKPKIDKIKEELTKALEELNAAMAAPDETEQLSGIAKIFDMTPEALEEEMAAKGQTLAEFIDNYKTKLAEAAAAEIEQVKTGKAWHDTMKDYALSVADSMSSAMTDIIMGTKSAKDALKDMVKTILQNAVKILTQWLAVYAIYSAFPTFASGMTPADAANKTVFHLATGGYVSGPGSGTSDSIPAMLSNGEYVLRSAAVNRIGVGALNAMNAGAVPHFADGGSVDDTIAASAGVGNVTVSVSAVDAASFGDFLNRGGLDQVKQALFEDNRQFASSVGVW